VEEVGGEFIHCTQQFSDMQIIPYSISYGWTGKSSRGKRGRTGGAGRRVLWRWGSGRRDPEWEGVAKAGGSRIRAVQWEANPKGGMEGAAGGVDKMSCRRRGTGVRMTQLGWESCRVMSSLQHKLGAWIAYPVQPAPVLEGLQ